MGHEEEPGTGTPVLPEVTHLPSCLLLSLPNPTRVFTLEESGPQAPRVKHVGRIRPPLKSFRTRQIAGNGRVRLQRSTYQMTCST